ncbi:nuclear transport factor 2 family protein [Marinitenerispora sediminis]|nr:nuclear transport factor 2 family protein [Marinitenerispora sediminis]
MTHINRAAPCPTGLVHAWHDAVNRGDAETAAGLCGPNVRVGGPRGGSGGRDAVRAWVGQAGVHLVPLRTWSVPGTTTTVVVEQQASWPGRPEPGAGEARRAASVFRVTDAGISAILRFADLPGALADAGLPADAPADE